MASANHHTQLVGWAKIALPLMALALLSTLFLFSGKVDPTTAVLYAKVDVEALVREPRLTTPEYSGVTEDGAALTVRAKTAVPATQGGGAEASDVMAKLEAPDGLVADMTANTARFDPAAGKIVLQDGVTLQTTTGYRMASQMLELATDRSSLISPGAVQAELPFGPLEAGAMELSRPALNAPYDLVFNGGVRLIYYPEK